MSLSNNRSAVVTVKDYDTGMRILRSRDFGVDHPFRATRQVFGPTVVDTEGDYHVNGKRSWMKEFLPQSIATDRVTSIIAEAVEEGFELATNEDDLMVASIYIPNRVLLKLLNADDVDPMEHHKKLRPITDFLETNERSKEAGEARSYLHSGPFNQCPGSLFSTLEDGQQQKELLLFAYAAGETTMVAMKNLLLFWAQNPSEFRTQIEEEGIQKFLVDSMRSDPPLGIAMRYCKNDVEIDGQQFAKGDLVHVSIVEGNKNCPVGNNGRPSVDLTFGAGKHSCPGHLLAKAELEAVARRLLTMDPSHYQVTGTPSAQRPMNFRDPGPLKIEAYS